MDEAQIGPSIPPHILEKRKRKAEEELARKAASAEPPTDDAKKKRLAGPAPPPAPLDELPTEPPRPDNSEEDDSDDGDDFGPMLPPTATTQEDEELAARRRLARFRGPEADAKSNNDDKPKRDEWMLVPPKSEDWVSKVDPTKIKNRKFNTAKGARAPNPAGQDNTLWTESPEERRKRLEDEVMGRKQPAAEGAEIPRARSDGAGAEETARRIREYNDKNRANSLYAEHKARSKTQEDDPSKRAFDREKDIAGGIRIGHKQKKEMLDRAAQFGSRFSSGSYL